MGAEKLHASDYAALIGPTRWVRKLSGAERYSNDVSAAIVVGTVRRAFLKGLGQTSGCKMLANPAAADSPLSESDLSQD